MELVVKKYTGEDTGRKVSLSDAVFAIEPNDHAIYLDVKQFLANQRQGTHKSKERNEVSGSTRKIKKQKGTGTARAGSIKSPVFVGGGRIFGPRPRTYGFKLNKKVKALARKSALTYKAKGESISVIEDFTFSAPKTKDFIKMLEVLALADKKTLVVLPAVDKNIVLSGRNLERSKVALAADVTTYDLLHADHVVFVESSIQTVENTLN
ncbi:MULTISPECIES: 50S ribosomal protein L4 [Imperialibacter]|jgi:large subunit ribosomal protein L4|uniref:Large ribosomal subunit protein uL4 n=1 Tax=Imperialibacter roseus TaxID=1324217 RepID=A0ABZ0IN84_9BACT|nr:MULTISPECIES: 50S ribosomal protein L4 [Imperialibacter]WOK05196.1 50S ribosomal protein L4 [Imperialibacter roseus]CAD5254655.1 50S ribosomal protein L4 [Imperialibacter sp. 75]CAD5263106.1 50S ribosomal protein L4 [Imperialibacter sp. 89]VVT35404.1 50S ribosomal protein L4 [Imperialibacter sp. EC-SDR9]|tara:strand:- start:619 stop:1245 length:627 start_codon:yes stop_codon:yes gene_type:complete